VENGSVQLAQFNDEVDELDAFPIQRRPPVRALEIGQTASELVGIIVENVIAHCDQQVVPGQKIEVKSPLAALAASVTSSTRLVALPCCLSLNKKTGRMAICAING
jgi:hypothetical protein